MGFCRTIMRRLIASLGAVLFACGAHAAVIHPAIWPQARPQIAPDPALERKVNDILAGMTVEEKVGQTIQADISTVTPDDLRKYPLGAVLAGGNSSPGGDELAPPSSGSS